MITYYQENTYLAHVGGNRMWKQKDRRKKLIINPFQYRLVVLHLVQFGAVVAIMLAALYIPLIMEFDRSDLSVYQKAELTNRFLELNSLLFPAALQSSSSWSSTVSSSTSAQRRS